MPVVIEGGADAVEVFGVGGDGDRGDAGGGLAVQGRVGDVRDGVGAALWGGAGICRVGRGGELPPTLR
jgi:hypothetical protein